MSTETQLKLELPPHQRAAQLWTRTGKYDPNTHTFFGYALPITAMYKNSWDFANNHTLNRPIMDI